MRWLALLAFFVVTPAFGQADVVASCGSVTIKAGTPHNVTVDLTGASCRLGGGGGGGPTVPSSVWSASDAALTGLVLSNGGLTFTSPSSLGSTWASIRGTVSNHSGKLYVEYKGGPAGQSNGDMMVGLAPAEFVPTGTLSSSIYSFGTAGFGNGYVSSGFTLHYDGANTGAVPNQVYGLAVDFDAGREWLSYNGAWFGSGSPSTGATPQITFTPSVVGPLFPAMSSDGGGGTGGWTLQATAASQTYPPPAGFVAWDSGSPPSASQAYLARTVGGNEGGNAANITALIDGLVADGVWSKLDAFYLPAQQNATDALLNLVGTSYPLTGTATFTTYQGFSGFSGSALDTGFNPTTASSPKFTQDSASISGWSYNGGNGALISNNPSPANAAILVNTFSNDYTDVNNVGGGGPPDYIASGGWFGLYSGDRNSATNVTFYLNGGNAQNYAQSSGTPNSSNLAVGSSAGAYPFSGIISEAHIGASLGSAGQAALYNRLLTYMTAVGWTPSVAKPGPKPPTTPEPKK
jgi:hypothetical protein